MRRQTLIDYVSKLPACVVAMEACCGAHYLGRLFAAHGHENPEDGLTGYRRLESPVNELALDAAVIFGAPGVRMSILAVGSPMRPYTLTQTDQITGKSHLQTGRAIRSFS